MRRFTAELKPSSAAKTFPKWPEPISARRSCERPRQRHPDSFSHVCGEIVTLFSPSADHCLCVCVCVSICARPRSSDCVLHTPGSPRSFVNTVGETRPPAASRPDPLSLSGSSTLACSDTHASRRRTDPNASRHQRGTRTMHLLMRDTVGCLQKAGIFFPFFFVLFLAASPHDFFGLTNDRRPTRAV